jgi:hypothetical protein
MTVYDLREAIKRAFGSVDEEKYVSFCETFYSGWFYYNADLMDTVEWCIDYDNVEDGLVAYNEQIGVDFLPGFDLDEFVKLCKMEDRLYFTYIHQNQVITVDRLVRQGLVL